MAYYRKPYSGQPMRRPHSSGVTPAQRKYIERLALQLSPVAEGTFEYDYAAAAKVLRDHGAPCDEYSGAVKLSTMTKFQASLLIESLLRSTNGKGGPVNDCPDPGELAEDRWNERYS